MGADSGFCGRLRPVALLDPPRPRIAPRRARLRSTHNTTQRAHPHPPTHPHTARAAAPARAARAAALAPRTPARAPRRALAARASVTTAEPATATAAKGVCVRERERGGERREGGLCARTQKRAPLNPPDLTPPSLPSHHHLPLPPPPHLPPAIANPVCIVTGSSRGIGKAIALALGAAGARVVVNYAASSAAADEVAATIKASGGDAIVVGANLSDPADIARLVDETVKQWGRIDVLVNNAGITRDTLMMRMKIDQVRESVGGWVG